MQKCSISTRYGMIKCHRFFAFQIFDEISISLFHILASLFKYHINYNAYCSLCRLNFREIYFLFPFPNLNNFGTLFKSTPSKVN